MAMTAVDAEGKLETTARKMILAFCGDDAIFFQNWLAEGGDPNLLADSEHEFSLVEVAVLFRCPAALRVLLEAGADPDHAPNRYRPLTRALRPAYGNDQLLPHKQLDDVRKRPIIPRHELVELLVKFGARPNKSDGDDGFSPLEHAIHHGFADVVPILLRYGADPNKSDGDGGFSPLEKAIRKGFVDVVSTLLRYGADPNKSDGDDGYSPLGGAIRTGFVDVVPTLLRYGADASESPLLAKAARDNKSALVALLLKFGADPDDLSYGVMPLHDAAAEKEDRCELTRVLLRGGASLDATLHGRTPEEVCRELEGNENTRRLLSDVTAAGGWKRYARAPRIQLLMLRELCRRGRAVAPRGPLRRLFSASFANSGAKRRAAHGASLPDSLFWLITSFWRSAQEVG